MAPIVNGEKLNVIRVNFQIGTSLRVGKRPATSDWGGPQSPEEGLEYMNVCLDADEEPVGLPEDLDI